MAFGDFTVSRAGTKWVLNSSGVLSEVAANVPAFEFNADGTYRGLLVEPAATNLALRSQEFDNASWLKSAGGTGVIPVVTQNNAVAPDGTTTADLIVFDRGVGNLVADRSIISQGPTVVSGTVYTASVWLKAATGADVGKEIAIRGVGGVIYITITLTADWVRYTRTEASVSTSGNIELASRGTITTDNTVSVHAWGAQLETGSVATSYIPTVASTANRVADSVTLTGASGLIGQTQGSMFAEVNTRLTVGTAGKRILSLSDGTVDNRIEIIKATNDGITLFAVAGGVTQVNETYSSNLSGILKIAVRYANNAFYLHVGGALRNSDTSATVPACSEIRIGNSTGGTLQFNDCIRSVALFPASLSEAQANALTA